MRRSRSGLCWLEPCSGVLARIERGGCGEDMDGDGLCAMVEQRGTILHTSLWQYV